jgi:hypothetical protein
MSSLRVYHYAYVIISPMSKYSDSKKQLLFLNGLSILLLVIGILIDKLFSFPGDMATGLVMLPIALLIWVVWLCTYVADFVAIFSWLAIRLGFSVRKRFIIILAILPLLAYIIMMPNGYSEIH